MPIYQFIQLLVVYESISKFLYPLSARLLGCTSFCVMFWKSSHDNRTIVVQRLSIYVQRVVRTEIVRWLLKRVIILVIYRSRSCTQVLFRSALYNGRWPHQATKGIGQSRSRGISRCLGCYSIVFKQCRVTGRHIVGDLDFNKNIRSIILIFGWC